MDLGAQQVSHSFLVIPECLAPLLERDLLSKVDVQIHFDSGGISVTDGLGQSIHVLSLALRDEYRLYLPKPPAAVDPAMLQWIQKYPLAWAEMAGVGLAKQRPMIKQYPILSQEARQGITPHIQRLLKVGILRKCRSPWNTPLLPVKKPRGTDFRLSKIFGKSANG